MARQQNFGTAVINGKIELALVELFNLEALGKATPAEPLIKSFWLPGTQIAGVRENEGSVKGFYFAAKGGNNGESHNHNDVGTFILYYNGEPALVDAGVGTYTRKTFSAQRYEIWTMQSLFHNVPMINSSPQEAGKKFAAKSVSFEQTGRMSRFSVDISGAYPETTNVKKWKRTYTLHENQRFVVADDFDLKKISGNTSLNFLSGCDIQEGPDGEVKIAGKDFVLKMTWDPNQYDLRVERIDLDDQRLMSA